MSRAIATLAAAAAVLLAGCGQREQPVAAATGASLATLTLQAGPVPRERRLNGLVEAVNQGTIAAQTAGRVEAINYDVGDFVPKGAVILRLRATEQRAGLAQAEAALREAGAREAEAQAQYQRIADMYERRVVPKAQFDSATAARDAAVSRLAAARAALDGAQESVAYTEVRAPYAGVFTRRLVQVGETVAPGTPLVSGLSLQNLRVVVDVPQSIAGQVRGLRKAAIYVDDQRIEAGRLTLFPEAAADSGTFRARLELPATATDLHPGMSVKVGIVTGEAPGLLLPRSRLVVPAETEEARLRELALADEKTRAALDGKQVVKVIVVPGKLVNLVVR